jgi:hypothetical protein
MASISKPGTPVLDLSKADAEPRALLSCSHLKLVAVGVAPAVTDAALRVLREGGRLKSLRLSSDQPQLPLAITELKSLQHLAINAPEIAGLPREIDRLKRLRSLELWTFQLGSLPRSIGALKHLRELTIESHELRRLPPQLAELEELRHLRLSFRGHFVPKKWGERPYFRARIEQSLPELFRLLAPLPRLSELTLGEPPRGWWCPDPIVREIPPELCLLESLETLTLIGCQVDVRLPIEEPGLARLRRLVAIDTTFDHSATELQAALPDTRIEIREDLELIRRAFGEHLARDLPASDLLEGTRRLLKAASNDASLASDIALGVGFLLFEDGQHHAAVWAAHDYEREASPTQSTAFARLLWANATLSTDPRSPDAALAALDKTASVPLNGLDDVLVAWHWLICVMAFRRLNQPDAEREAMDHARELPGPVELTAPPLLQRLRRWLAREPASSERV